MIDSRRDVGFLEPLIDELNKGPNSESSGIFPIRGNSEMPAKPSLLYIEVRPTEKEKADRFCVRRENNFFERANEV